MRRLNRAEQRERKELIRAFASGLKSAACARKWKYLNPSPFRTVGEWFIDVFPSIHQDEVRASISVSIKPRRIDDLMHQLKTGRHLGKHPLSLLARGVYCFGVRVLEEDMDSAAGVDALLDTALACLDKAEDIATGFGLDDFYERVMLRRGVGGIPVEGIAALLMQNEYALSRKLLAKSRDPASKGLSSSHGIRAEDIERWMERHPYGPPRVS